MLRPISIPKFNFIPQTFVNGVHFHDFVNNKLAHRVVSEVPLINKTNDIQIQRKILPHSSKLDVMQLEEGVNVVLQKPAQIANSNALSNETSGRKIRTALSTYFDNHFNKSAELDFKKEKAKNLQKLVKEYENENSEVQLVRKENQKLMQKDAKREWELFKADDAAEEAMLNKEWAQDFESNLNEYLNEENWKDLWNWRV